MRFTAKQTFRASPDQVAAAYAHNELYPTLTGLPKLGDIEPLSEKSDGDVVTQRIRFRFVDHLPSAVTAVVDPKKLSWIQESETDLSTNEATFRLLPDHYPDRLKASGTFTISPKGKGAVREISGEVKVKAFLVAGKVEEAIISGLKEYLEAEAPRVDEWIESQSG